MTAYEPLAEKYRPLKLSEVVGQKHLLAKNALLSQIIKSKKPFSLILWGPPGSGKTTLARIIANETDADFIEISAVTAGIADVKHVIKTAGENRRLGLQTLLFVDEIHRFNKAQQDAFLPHIESGLITLIGATTENPSFEVITPLLSRSRVLVLEPLSDSEIVKILKRITKVTNQDKRLNNQVYEYIAGISDGDARVAIGNLELILNLKQGEVTLIEAKEIINKKLPSYDKSGDQHYNIISAFIKSMRGSDANATLYYLARMLNAGEDPKFIARRMIIFASEDIGIASSPALNLAVSTFLAVERIGMPECQYNLFHTALVLASAKKSRVVADVMNKAIMAANKYPSLKVPSHLRNASSKMMAELGYAEGYKWESGFKHDKGFLPNEIKDLNLFN